MKSTKVIFLIILFSFLVVNGGISTAEADERTISTPEWIFKVTSFKSGLLRPALKKDKYTFDFKLKVNGEQNLILVEIVDKKGKGFVAMGDEARFDCSRTIEFKSNQFPVKMGICFYLPADIQSFEFSIDDSTRLKLNGL